MAAPVRAALMITCLGDMFFPEVSSAILDRKLANVEATGARCLVACDAGCLMQMGGGLTRRGSTVRAVHLAQVLAGEVSR